MKKKHQKRKGIGCRFEYQLEPHTPLFCEHAEFSFGGYHECIAPKKCWLDEKIARPFIDGKHCPNCSKPNKPFKIIRDDKHNAHCPKCKYHEQTTFASK